MGDSEHDDRDTPCYRSGAAARLAKMPVTTLRIWERRYAVVDPGKSASGQRLYSARDVQRLALIKALVEKGHAISAIAKLDYSHLLQLLPAVPTANLQSAHQGVAELHLLVVGDLLRQRLNADGFNIEPAMAFADIQAAMDASSLSGVEALLVHVASLQADIAQQLLVLAARCAAGALGVVYAFGTAAAVDTLRMAGAHLYRETVGSLDIAVILRDLQRGRAVPDGDINAPHWGRAQRRLSDPSLSAAVRMSTTIACECPRHLAELIMQISAFEEYSDNCASRSASDAVLHRYLGDISSHARAMFEMALERVIREEGGELP